MTSHSGVVGVVFDAVLAASVMRHVSQMGAARTAQLAPPTYLLPWRYQL
jgi:hypothetical protein